MDAPLDVKGPREPRIDPSVANAAAPSSARPRSKKFGLTYAPPRRRRFLFE
jgi:hypothetical protein